MTRSTVASTFAVVLEAEDRGTVERGRANLLPRYPSGESFGDRIVAMTFTSRIPGCGTVTSRRALAGLVLLAAALSIGANAPQAWPSSRVKTLSGKEVVLPEALGGTSVLVVGFTRASRAHTAPWSQRLLADSAINAKASVYEVMVLENVPGFIASRVVKQVASVVPVARHDRFLVVSEDVSTWRRMLDVGDEDEAYVAVVDSRGVVKWRHGGALDEASWSRLVTQLQ